jgi:hypothetical protein
VAERREQARHQPGQAGEAVGQAGQRRAADSRDVETDDLEGGIERVDERLQQLQAGADAVDQQQRRPPAGSRPDVDAQRRPRPRCCGSSAALASGGS